MATTYYLDSLRGCDQNDGRTPDTPWKSLEKANQLIFTPGDSLLLAKGSAWEGCLMPRGAGECARRCVIGSYGAGPRPAIHAQGRAEAAVHLRNTQGWVVRGLEVTNTGAERANHRAGILAELDNYGTAYGITIQDNDIHDVNGSNVKAEGDTKGGIIVRAQGEEIPSRFIDVQIRDNRVVTCDRIGIYINGMGRRTRRFPCLGVVIYGNYLEDIGGDGILNIGTDGCIVERNRLLGGRMRDEMYCAGIWPWSADNTIIRYNEAAYYYGTKDGEGFDCDYNCVGTVQQYNYSHDNDGGFMLVCTPFCTGEYANPENIGCVNSDIRRNLSVNDKSCLVSLCGEIIGTRFEENCLYSGAGMDLPAIACVSGYGQKNYPQQVLISRNIFAARGVQRFGRITEFFPDDTFVLQEDPADPLVRYMGNAYLGNHPIPPQDPGAPVPAPTLEEIEAVVLDENGRAKPGLETLDAFLDLMGWPKA